MAEETTRKAKEDARIALEIAQKHEKEKWEQRLAANRELMRKYAAVNNTSYDEQPPLEMPNQPSDNSSHAIQQDNGSGQAASRICIIM